MALFDSILDTIKPLSDFGKEVKGVVNEIKDNPLYELVRDYTRGSESVTEKKMAVAKAKSEQLKPNLQKINVQAGDAKWGLENYASDPAAIEQRWQTILTSFIAPSATKGT